jgi:ABC-type sugar transport system permease subunit
VITFQFVMGFIGGMKEFGLPLVMTTGGGGGISLSAITPVLLVYKAGFTSFEMGYASAVAFLLTLLLIVATILQFRLYGKSEAYE